MIKSISALIAKSFHLIGFFFLPSSSFLLSGGFASYFSFICYFSDLRRFFSASALYRSVDRQKVSGVLYGGHLLPVLFFCCLGLPAAGLAFAVGLFVVPVQLSKDTVPFRLLPVRSQCSI